jgi:hypothetical protein
MLVSVHRPQKYVGISGLKMMKQEVSLNFRMNGMLGPRGEEKAQGVLGHEE